MLKIDIYTIDNFVGRMAMGIYSLSKEFSNSWVYFELEDAPQSIGYDTDSTIRLLLSTQEYGYAQGPLYLLVRFLSASI